MKPGRSIALALLMLLSIVAHAEPEIFWVDSITIRGQLDCVGKMSIRCGGFDDLNLLSDRFRRGQPGSGAEDGAQSWRERTLKAKPKAEQNSNKNSEEDCKSTRNPVVIATGEKHKEELDFAARGKYGLNLQRTYRSMQATGSMFGPNWLSSLDPVKLVPSNYFRPKPKWPSIPKTVTVIDADGTKFSYDYQPASGPRATIGRADVREPASPNATEESGVPESYSYQSRGAAAPGRLTYALGEGWTLVRDKQLYVFNQTLRLTQVLDEAGNNVLVYAYDTTPAQKLERVINAVGQSVKVHWGANGRVDEVRDTAGSVWLYGYDGNGMLTTVTSPGESADIRTYHYEAGDPTLLTGISINGQRYSTYRYTGDRRVEVSALAGEEEKDTFGYGDKVTYVTDVRGQVTGYSHADLDGELKVSSVTRQASSTCSEASAVTVYDSNGYIDFKRDWNGNKSDYTFDSAECVNHFETMNFMSLVSNSLDFPRFPPPVLAC